MNIIAKRSLQTIIRRGAFGGFKRNNLLNVSKFITFKKFSIKNKSNFQLQVQNDQSQLQKQKAIEHLHQQQLPLQQNEPLPKIPLQKRVQSINLQKRDQLNTLQQQSSQIEALKAPTYLQARQYQIQQYQEEKQVIKRAHFYRMAGIALFILGSAFLFIPLYKVICEQTGLTVATHAKDYIFPESKVRIHRKFKVKFLAQIQNDEELPWVFQPQQDYVIVNPGQTALAFYKAYNKTDKPIIGISIYQVMPEDASLYFNKIQCFCFENQMLYPKEEVFLPVFFYLDPMIVHQAELKNTQEIIIRYQFFKARNQEIANIVQKELEKHQENQKKLEEKVNKLKSEGQYQGENVLGERQKLMKKYSAQPGLSPNKMSEELIKKLGELEKKV